VAKSGAARKRDTAPEHPSGRSRLAKVSGSAGARAGAHAAELDRIIHERLRLAIVSALAVNPKLSFTELKRLVDTSDGNLSVHARKLEEAGYITSEKGFEDRMPRTDYSLTRQGRAALENYLGHMEALIRATRRG
jgi:DNA-binding MarR family transcriptional regulator